MRSIGTIDTPQRSVPPAPPALPARRGATASAALGAGALEALVAVAFGLGAPLAIGLLLWAVQYSDDVAWTTLLRAAADGWLLGHGVDIRFTPDAVTAAAIGGDGSFVVTLAPLGFALVTLLLGVAAGRRIGTGAAVRAGALAAVLAFALLAGAVALAAWAPGAQPSRWQGALLPTLWWTAGIVIGAEVQRARMLADGAPWSGGLLGETARDLVYDLPERVRRTAASALRGGTAAAAVVLAVAAATTGVLLVVHFADFIALFERLQPGVVGGLALTLAQLALLPTLIVWALSWFAGPGFAVGAGSGIGPFGVAAGPLPALPVLGALPDTGDGAFGLLFLLVPVGAGVVAGVLLARRDGAAFPGLGERAVLAASVGVVAGLAALLLAVAASGAAGPGRLTEVGPHALLVGAAFAGEVGLGALIGLITAGRREPAAEDRGHPAGV